MTLPDPHLPLNPGHVWDPAPEDQDRDPAATEATGEAPVDTESQPGD